MKTFIAPLAVLVLSTAALAEAPKAAPSVGNTLDRQLSIIEGDLVPLVEAMPEDKLDFAPPGEGFKGVRTFRQQVGHVGAALHRFAGIILGEEGKQAEADEGTNGPTSLKTRADYAKYLKEAFAHAHKACASVTEKNQLDPVQLGANFKSNKLGFANLLTWHSFDHYGQLVVYARMNNVVPPASRGGN